MSETQTVVIGAGIVGLAIARELAFSGREVVVVEAAYKFGTETSSRNSEVIHAGIYYPRDSLKARLCVEGKALLYQYCREQSIPYKSCGKIIVATEENQIGTLQKLKQSGETNGVTDLRLIDPEEARGLEPEVKCIAALVSPSTGIIDSHVYMESLIREFESQGGAIAYNTRMISAAAESSGFTLRFLESSGTSFELRCRELINSAGLGAQEVAHSIKGMPDALIPKRYLSKGNYFTLSGRPPFHGLVYPVPEVGALGIHSVLDIGGGTRFGPDQEIISEVSYDLDPKRGESFYAAIRKYYPELKDASLQPGFCGIRSKLHAPGTPAADFRIQSHQEHGIKGLIHLFGIESPGLTASLAIAKHVRKHLEAVSF